MLTLFKSKLFRTLFLSFFSIILLTFATLSLFLSNITRESLIHQQLIIAESYRDEVSDNLSRWLLGRVLNVKNQAQYLAEFDDEFLYSDKLTSLFDELLGWNTYYYDFVIIDENGSVINSRVGKANDSINVSDREYFIEAFNGETFVSGFFKDRRDGLPLFAISTPIYIEGKLKYILAGYIHLENFTAIVEGLSLDDLGHVYLVDTEQVVITNTNYIGAYIKRADMSDKSEFQIHTEASENVALKHAGSGLYLDYEEDEVIGSYKWLDGLDVGLIVELKASKVMSPLAYLHSILILLSFIITVLGFGIAFAITNRLLNPVNQLIEAAKNLTNERQPLNVETTNTEFDVLVDSFNVMQVAIQHREDLLKKQNEELRAQRAEAIEATRLKSQFVANMSHELRTPLNAIIGFSARILKKVGNEMPTSQRENLEIVKKEGEHLLDLINNLLDYSKLEAGKIDLHLEEINLLSIAEEVQGIIKHYLMEKQIAYKEIFPDVSTLPIYSDRVKIKQILINLISNSFKYSEKGTITFSIKSVNNFYQLSVEDEGVGISPEHLNVIFDEFRQIDGSYTRKVGGTGLGLSITKRFVELLGGTIEAQSIVGKGSIFTVYLPISVVDSSLAVTPSSANNELQKKTVVCVDDDPGVRKIYKYYLTEHGYNVHTLDGYEPVVSQIVDIQPDIVVLDIILPSMDGWEILAELKTNPLTRHIPVIMASVLSEQRLAYKMKADDYLVKPITQSQLLDAINNIIQVQGTEILVVDDDINHLKLIGQYLKEQNLTYTLAENGLRALELINNHKPTIILLDLMMPHMDGFELLDTIRSHPEWNDIHVIVVSAKQLSNEEKEFLQERAQSVVQKSGTQFESLILQVMYELKK